MIHYLLNFLGLGILSGVLAIATIIGNAMRIDKDPAVDGPRALIAEFFGLWIAFACLAWSFMISGPELVQWLMRGVAASAAILAFALAAYFAGTPEVQISFDEEPTGFDVPITTLQLHGLDSSVPGDVGVISVSPREGRDHSWSELHPQS